MAERQETIEAPVLTGGERTREEILAAAREMLRESGFRGFSVAALMERASVSRPAFYQYFASRYDVVTEIVQRFTAEMDKVATPWLEEPEAGRDSLLEGLMAVAEFFASDATLFRSIVDAASADPQVEQAWTHSFLGYYRERTERKILAEQKRGITPKEIDAHLTALALVLMTERVYYDRLTGDSPDVTRQVADVVCNIWSSTIYPCM